MEGIQTISLAPQELSGLIARVRAALPELNRTDELADVRYDDPNARERYRDALEGRLPGVTVSDEAAAGGADPAELAALFAAAKSRLARSAVLHVCKAARAAVQDERYSATEREALWQVLEDIRRRERAKFGAVQDVVGTSQDPDRWIYAYENGPMVREVTVKSRRPNGKPLEIVQLSDTHYNLCNERDLAEADPALMSTLEHRLWHANGDSVPSVERAFSYAAMSDQTVVTGDILDYLSWGGQELTVRQLFWRDRDLLAAIGGHDVTREMQGTVADPSSLESRLDILRAFWCNDVSYTSRLLGDRVILSVMDNGSTGRYSEAQYRSLQADIAYAREHDLILLIFQHEPICTCNPAETNVDYVRPNDMSGSRNFCHDGIGGDWTRKQREEWTLRTHQLIRESADVIRGVFCGHWHSDLYTEILGTDGTVIPQYILTAAVYDGMGHVMKITVD